MEQQPAPGAAGQEQKFLATLEHLLGLPALAVKPAVDSASNALVPTLGADKVDVFLYETATHTLVAVGTSGTPMGLKQHALGLARLPLANGGRTVGVFQSGESYHNNAVDSDPEELRGIREALGVRSTVIVPLTIDGVRRGVVQACSARPDAFSPTDAAYLHAVANWVGLVVQRAELVEQLTRKARADAQRMAAEELLRVFAHDLRNMLQPLLGGVELLRARAEREARARDVRDASRLQEGIRRLSHLVTDLLDMARIEQGVFAVMPQPLNISQLVLSAAAPLQDQGLALEVQAPEEIVALVDRDRLQRAVEHLLANAHQHAAGCAVRLAVRSEERGGAPWAVVEVRDNGPGIAADLLERIGERFVRGGGSAGLGVGLYLARRVAEAHGGALEVETAEDQGATLRIVLPLVTS